MKLALTTEEETSQLRRLNVALDSNRFDHCLRRELDSSTIQAKELARKLGLADTAPEDKLAEEQNLAKTRTAVYCPPAQDSSSLKEVDEKPVASAPTDVAQVDVSDPELEKAATKIQAIQRGKLARRGTAEMMEAKEE
jgi:hypothetical protein